VFAEQGHAVTGLTSAPPVVIIGAGVTGLTLAYRLHQAGNNAIVFEAGERMGGNICTAKHDGFVYDLGPDSFLKTKPGGTRLCHDLGLGAELITPQDGATAVHVAHAGKLHPMPEGLSLGVPRRAWPILKTPLLSPGAKLRALMEPFMRTRPDGDEESISEFLSRRLGSEMAERLAAPLLAGVFAGDATALSINAAFPQLVALEKKHGSLFSGLNGGKSLLQVLLSPVVSAESPFMSLKGGLSDLIAALGRALPSHSVRLSTRALGVTPPQQGAPAHVRTSEGLVAAARVVIATPPWSARNLLQEVDADLLESLGSVKGFSTATVFFGLDRKDVAPRLLGSGFIVPPGEADILAATYISSKWEGRAPEGTELVRVFVGGARKDISGCSADELRSIARRELARYLGDLGSVLFERVHRYEKGSPQPVKGYLEVLRRVREAEQNHPWLSLIGAGYGGVGIPDCIAQADDLAQRIIAE
jgi:protoporphyrinogen/coproporphyrinogen III oxidase